MRAIMRLNKVQFEALSELLRLRAESKSRLGAQYVLVDGYEIGDAARAVGLPYKDIHRAVTAVKHGYELAQIVTKIQ
jgi:hypothetical protein